MSRAGITAILIAASCSDASAPGQGPLVFDFGTVELGGLRDTVLTLRNDGDAAYGPIELIARQIVDGSGNAIPGPQTALVPAEIATLNPGMSQPIGVTIDVPVETPDGDYAAVIDAWLFGIGTMATVILSFDVDTEAANAGVAELEIFGPTVTPRQGDVNQFTATARDAQGSTVTGPVIQWLVSPSQNGIVDREGRFVGYVPGAVRLVARAGSAADTIELDVSARMGSAAISVVGQGLIDTRFTSDLWVAGQTAYTGTWSTRTIGTQSWSGNTLYAWNIADPAAPTLTDSVSIDARVVNDVKVHADGDLAVITHEASADGQNGITLLDLGDPSHPAPIRRFSTSLQTGVHNAWLDGNYVYLVVDGASPTSGLRILDISDPTNPIVVSEFYGGSSFLHDVYVRDGLAFLSHWNAGLIILDVGHGLAGGAPDNPVEVSRVLTQGGQTHNAWYWPASAYVFVGEEDFGSPGIMHVIDVSDLRRPREVATFTVPGTTPHNFWLDEGNSVLYLAWYGNGLRVLDVSGALLGELDRQGRELAGLRYDGASTHTWAPHLHNGLIYVSDLNSGLWVLSVQ